jgi:hypothetical protein
MLHLGIATHRDRKRSNPTQALLYVIGSLANRCSFTQRGGVERHEWNTTPFVFASFRHAVSLLFEELEDRLPLKGPSAMKDETPEGFGRWAFRSVWDDLLAVKPPSTEDASLGLTEDQTLDWRRSGYDSMRTRRDLGLEEKKS